jgi:hypothetical protein
MNRTAAGQVPEPAPPPAAVVPDAGALPDAAGLLVLGLLVAVLVAGLVLQAVVVARARRRSRALAALLGALAEAAEPCRQGRELSARALVAAAGALLPGTRVEVLSLAGDGPVRTWLHVDGTVRREPTGLAAYDDPVVTAALGGRAGPAEHAAAVAVAVALAGAQPPAVLVARRRDGAAPLRGRDLRVLRDLAAVLPSPGSRAAAPGGPAAAVPVGPTTAALERLRDAADRLARLAEQTVPAEGTVPAAEVVAELQVVERAVAAVLGGAAASVDTPATVDPLRPGNAGLEWTTTGLLR